MLKKIQIENFALIDKLVLEFDFGYNAITGETGSGKSIMVDSLNFVFGERADKNNIRQGQTQMSVCAEFINLSESVKQHLKSSLNLDIADSLILERTYDTTGKNICKINKVLSSTAKLWEISHMLVDIHGQHEHQSIILNEYQLGILDLFCRQDASLFLEKLNELIDKVQSINKNIELLGGSIEQKQNLIDLYSYQVTEIENLAASQDEFDELTNKRKEMLSYEKIASALSEYCENACESPYKETARDLIVNAKKNLLSIENVSDNFAALSKRLASILAEFEDINDEVKNIVNSLNFSQEEFDRIDGRLDAIKSACKKYGGSIDAMNEYLKGTSKKLDILLNSEAEHGRLLSEKSKILNEINEICLKLSAVRKKYAVTLAELIQKELTELGMKNAVLEIDFNQTEHEYTRKGIDEIEFMFSANLGFAPKPLKKVISGGEMSRFMLAYKMVVGNLDQIDTMIFDEIDSGLSGAMAQTVANTLARLSRQKQIIVITHLPQIASMADINFYVTKSTADNSTKTKLIQLDRDNLYTEIARLMGATSGEQARIVAKELKDKSNMYKQAL